LGNNWRAAIRESFILIGIEQPLSSSTLGVGEEHFVMAFTPATGATIGILLLQAVFWLMVVTTQGM
jgi:hypothetical protein